MDLDEKTLVVVKPFKSLDAQIDYLETNKNIIFNDKGSAKKFLLDNNYYNVISSAKIYACLSIGNGGKHLYQKLPFELWKTHYETDCFVSTILLRNIIAIDKKINSRLAYYLSEIINKGLLTQQEKDKLRLIINEKKQNIKENYQFEHTWIYITSFTFKSTFTVLSEIKNWISFRQRQGGNRQQAQYLQFCYNSIIKEYANIKSISELINLRNHLAHYVPLSVYTTAKGSYLDRTQVIKIVANERYDAVVDSALKSLFEVSSNFRKMKKASK